MAVASDKRHVGMWCARRDALNARICVLSTRVRLLTRRLIGLSTCVHATQVVRQPASSLRQEPRRRQDYGRDGFWQRRVLVPSGEPSWSAGQHRQLRTQHTRWANPSLLYFGNHLSFLQRIWYCTLYCTLYIVHWYWHCTGARHDNRSGSFCVQYPSVTQWCSNGMGTVGIVQGPGPRVQGPSSSRQKIIIIFTLQWKLGQKRVGL